MGKHGSPMESPMDPMAMGHNNKMSSHDCAKHNSENDHPRQQSLDIIRLTSFLQKHLFIL